MSDTVVVSRKYLQKLVTNFFRTCSLCDEMDIYEFEEGDQSMQKMKKWVDKKFTRTINKDSYLKDSDANVIAAKDELLKIYESQIMDLTMMSKIELGDDVITEVLRLKGIIGIKEPQE